MSVLRLIDRLLELKEACFYGELIIKFQNGQVTIVKESKTYNNVEI